MKRLTYSTDRTRYLLRRLPDERERLDVPVELDRLDVPVELDRLDEPVDRERVDEPLELDELRREVDELRDTDDRLDGERFRDVRELGREVGDVDIVRGPVRRAVPVPPGA